MYFNAQLEIKCSFNVHLNVFLRLNYLAISKHLKTHLQSKILDIKLDKGAAHALSPTGLNT